MMRVMAATRMERDGRWPSEGFMRMGARTFSRLYAREKEKRFNAEGAEIGHGDRREERRGKPKSTAPSKLRVNRNRCATVAGAVRESELALWRRAISISAPTRKPIVEMRRISRWL